MSWLKPETDRKPLSKLEQAKENEQLDNYLANIKAAKETIASLQDSIKQLASVKGQLETDNHIFLQARLAEIQTIKNEEQQKRDLANQLLAEAEQQHGILDEKLADMLKAHDEFEQERQAAEEKRVADLHVLSSYQEELKELDLSLKARAAAMQSGEDLLEKDKQDLQHEIAAFNIMRDDYTVTAANVRNGKTELELDLAAFAVEKKALFDSRAAMTEQLKNSQQNLQDAETAKAEALAVLKAAESAKHDTLNLVVENNRLIAEADNKIKLANEKQALLNQDLERLEALKKWINENSMKNGGK